MKTSCIICRFGEGYSHVAAVMFKVECAVRLGHTSVTSQACRWNEVFCKKVINVHEIDNNWPCVLPMNSICCLQIEPSIIAETEFQRPKRGRDINTSTDRQSSQPKKSNIPPPPSDAEEVFLTGLKEVMPTAVIFSSVAPMECSVSQHSTPVRRLPTLFTSLQHPMQECQQMSSKLLVKMSSPI